VVEGPDLFGERGNRRVVGDVDGLRGDVGLVIGRRELGAITSRHDDSRTLGEGQQGHGTGDAAAAPNYQDGLIFQRSHS
jgi:hypothetical protein